MALLFGDDASPTTTGVALGYECCPGYPTAIEVSVLTNREEEEADIAIIGLVTEPPSSLACTYTNSMG